MPIPAPNLYPDFNTIRLSHACLNVRDLAASKKFYTEIFGLQLSLIHISEPTRQEESRMPSSA